MLSEVFKQCIFKDKKCQRTLLSLSTTSHKTGHGLSHCCDIQGTCSKCLSPAKGAEGRLRWFLPLIQDFNLNSPRYSPSLISLLFFWHCFQTKVTSQTEATKCKKVSHAERNTIFSYLTKVCCCADSSSSMAQLWPTAHFYHKFHSLYPTPSIYSFLLL